MTAKDSLEADLVSMLLGCNWGRKDAEQMAKRLAAGAVAIAQEAIQYTCAKPKPYDGNIEDGI